MRRTTPILAVLLAGCSTPTGEVQLTLSALQTSGSRSAITTFTPTAFQMNVPGVLLFGDGTEETLYEPDGDPSVELAVSGNPAIEANQAVPVGVYDSMEIQSDRVVTVAGCAVMDGATHCTRSDLAASSLTDTAEPVAVQTAATIDAVLPGPVEVVEGDVVELNLYYDLTYAVSFIDEPGPAPSDESFGRIGFGNDTSIEIKYPPLFAFIGVAPVAEIYEIALTNDPDPTSPPSLEAYYFPTDKWKVRMWIFFDDDGEPLARRDVWVAEEGADGAALVSMFGNAADIFLNERGLYTIEDPDADPAFQSWRMTSFERASHDGVATWIHPEGTKLIDYTVTRLQ